MILFFFEGSCNQTFFSAGWVKFNPSHQFRSQRGEMPDLIYVCLKPAVWRKICLIAASQQQDLVCFWFLKAAALYSFNWNSINLLNWMNWVDWMAAEIKKQTPNPKLLGKNLIAFRPLLLSHSNLACKDSILMPKNWSSNQITLSLACEVN